MRFRQTLFEAVNAATGVGNLFGAGVKRVAGGTDTRTQRFAGGSDFKFVAACAGNLCFGEICGVDIGFHDSGSIAWGGANVQKEACQNRANLLVYLSVITQ